MAGKGRPGPAKRFTAEELADRDRIASAERQRRIVAAGQEIGAIPQVADWNRRESCRDDPERFLQTYFGFGDYFSRPFCDDHRKVIAKGAEVGRNGGLAAIAMPRGHGKTTICRGLSIWGIAYGLQRFVFLIGAASGLAKRSMFAIKKMMMDSPAFVEDFPEISYPVLKLGGTINRQKGQMCLGVQTAINWSNEYLKLPVISKQPSMRPEQHLCGGAIFYASGLLGSSITGMNIEGIRPSMVILDDPQTRESAQKDSACAKREEIIDATVAGLAGPGIRLAVLMPLTVIREGDLADRYLNHVLHPEWAIERAQLLHAMPTNTELWDANKEIRHNYNPFLGPADKKRAETDATLHYIDNQEKMDEGAIASWAERYNPDEVSAIQNCMNLLADNRRAFFAEMQNKPLPPDIGDVKQLTPDEICAKLSTIPRGVVPMDVSTLTAFIDVQKSVLYWGVAGWRENFTGYIIDYGVFPQQGRPYFTLSDISMTMEKSLGMAGVGEEAIIRAGLTSLTDWIMGREWLRENGQPYRVDLCLVDSGKWSKMIYEFCRRQPHGPRVMPSKGVYFGAGSKKASGEGEAKPGDRRGWHWHLPSAKEERGVKLLLYDTNPWKSFIHARLATVPSAIGCLSLFGTDKGVHRMYADHLTAEYRDRQSSERTGRTVEEWHEKPGSPDNHWLDVTAGLAVAASVQGVALDGVYKSTKPERTNKKGGRSWAELKRQAAATK